MKNCENVATVNPMLQVKLVIGKVVFTASVTSEIEQVSILLLLSIPIVDLHRTQIVGYVLAQSEMAGEVKNHWLQVLRIT